MPMEPVSVQKSQPNQTMLEDVADIRESQLEELRDGSSVMVKIPVIFRDRWQLYQTTTGAVYAFDTELLIQHLQKLKAGHSIQCPVYSFVEHNRTDQTVEIQAGETVTVAMHNKLVPEVPTVPQTGDSPWMPAVLIGLSALALLAGGGLLAMHLVGKKKRSAGGHGRDQDIR